MNRHDGTAARAQHHRAPLAAVAHAPADTAGAECLLHGDPPQKSQLHQRHELHQKPAKMRLRDAGLRPTRQRLALAGLLFSGRERHVSAEQLHEEAVTARVPVSLATIYNTLHQFTDAGLLREVAVDGSKTYFDTNTGEHHHFFLEEENEVFDIPHSHIGISDVPEPPPGMEIVRVDVVVRVRRKG